MTTVPFGPWVAVPGAERFAGFAVCVHELQHHDRIAACSVLVVDLGSSSSWLSKPHNLLVGESCVPSNTGGLASSVVVAEQSSEIVAGSPVNAMTGNVIVASVSQLRLLSVVSAGLSTHVCLRGHVFSAHRYVKRQQNPGIYDVSSYLSILSLFSTHSLHF